MKRLKLNEYIRLSKDKLYYVKDKYLKRFKLYYGNSYVVSYSFNKKQIDKSCGLVTCFSSKSTVFSVTMKQALKLSKKLESGVL